MVSLLDYIADPAALVVIGLNILVNVGDSLRIRSEAGNHQTALAQFIVCPKMIGWQANKRNA